MSKKFVGLMACLCFAWLLPLTAQDEDLKNLNFNIGGGFAVPVNPTGRYLGVNGTAMGGRELAPTSARIIPSRATNFLVERTLASDLPHFTPSTLRREASTPVRVYGRLSALHLFDNISEFLFRAALVLGGGGYYYRHFSVDMNFFVPAGAYHVLPTGVFLVGISMQSVGLRDIPNNRHSREQRGRFKKGADVLRSTCWARDGASSPEALPLHVEPIHFIRTRNHKSSASSC